MPDKKSLSILVLLFFFIFPKASTIKNYMGDSIVLNKKYNRGGSLAIIDNETAKIPNIFHFGRIGKVEVTYGKTNDGLSANQLVKRDLILALNEALLLANIALPEKYKIYHIHISSTTNGKHSTGSNHYYGTAIDISKINHTPLVNIGANIQVRELQKALTKCQLIRENFGPYSHEKKKLDGSIQKIYVRGHHNHIHFAVQGEHNGEKCDECSDSSKYLLPINRKFSLVSIKVD